MQFLQRRLLVLANTPALSPNRRRPTIFDRCVFDFVCGCPNKGLIHLILELFSIIWLILATSESALRISFRESRSISNNLLFSTLLRSMTLRAN